MATCSSILAWRTPQTEKPGRLQFMGLQSQRYDQVTNIQRYDYGSTYMNSMVTTNQKPTTDRQKTKRKEFKHTAEENHQTTMGKTKRRNEQRTTETTGSQGMKRKQAHTDQ